ncbi:GTP 3',8-cyclase MoaA [Macrococcus equipercicus]|uniref:GTP 3',8-cyclase n=1 Tax=Macrococcus equipercicus TaxID=69967 RepID=A0A9Q9BQS4_9STAP|nr:GTP 3',8-cyclase MoaA [Macrococcus equipercicus]UTH13966.1 GTP 3',8-cyclase MoaA [Macrococcus equipercicus]
MTEQITDKLGRPIRDLRISVTDRCNFRCSYCMPKEIFGDDFVFLPKDELLSFEELVRIATQYAALGVKKIRITGGEPLLRRDLPLLINALNQIPGIEDIGLTTNGMLLKKHGQALYDAGLRRLNISLDALDHVFEEVNGRGIKAAAILEQIDYANGLGFQIKVNMVVQKGMNDHQLLAMTDYFKGRNITLRFIEFMDVGNDNGWNFDQVVTKAEMIQLIEQHYDITPVKPKYFGEVAKYYEHDNGAKIGFITSVSESFCSSCTRVRLSSDGKIYGCLFAGSGFDLKGLLRQGVSDEELKAQLVAFWRKRDDHYSDERTAETVKNRQQKKINMNYIGG